MRACGWNYEWAYDCDEAIRRLQAFEAVGADCLYAPVPASWEDLKRICASVKAPVNALTAGQFRDFTRSDFAKIGVARISLGSQLARVTHQAILSAARGIIVDGDCSQLNAAANADEIDRLLSS